MAIFEFRIITEDAGMSDEDMTADGIAAIEAAIAINMGYFRRNPSAMCALALGKIRYDSKNKNTLSMISEIKTAPVMIKKGVALCNEIVAFDVAVRRCEGQNAFPGIISAGGGYYHVITGVTLPGGSVVEYDPSAEIEKKGYATSFQPAYCQAKGF